MKGNAIVGLGLFGLSLAAPALAEQATATASAPTEERVVCRRLVPTGSTVAKKVCKPASVWATMEDANRDSATKLVDRASAAASPLK